MQDKSQLRRLEKFVNFASHTPGSVTENDIREAEDLAMDVIRSRTEDAVLVLTAVRAFALAIVFQNSINTPAECPHRISCLVQRLVTNHTQRGNIHPQVAADPLFEKVNVSCSRVCGAPIRDVPVPRAEDLIEYGNVYSSVSYD